MQPPREARDRGQPPPGMLILGVELVGDHGMGPEATNPVLQTVGNYDLLERIAEGGMGTVYKARDRASGEIVAIKIVPAQVTRNSIMMKRFEQEYNVARQLDHPNIVRALDFGFHGASPFLVMEF